MGFPRTHLLPSHIPLCIPSLPWPTIRVMQRRDPHAGHHLQVAPCLTVIVRVLYLILPVPLLQQATLPRCPSHPLRLRAPDEGPSSRHHRLPLAPSRHLAATIQPGRQPASLAACVAWTLGQLLGPSKGRPAAKDGEGEALVWQCELYGSTGGLVGGRGCGRS